MERAKIHGKHLNYCLIEFCLSLNFLDNFIKEQLHQYNIGKRHLANMMGKDPEFFTQHDVNVISLLKISFEIKKKKLCYNLCFIYI
jgi:hypothetical protein